MQKKELFTKVLYIAGILAAVYFGLKYLLPLIVPFLFAYILAGWLNPVVKKISEKTIISRKLSAPLTLIVVLVVVGFLLVWLCSTLVNQIRSLAVDIPFIKKGLCTGFLNCCGCMEKWFGIKSGSIYGTLQYGVDYLGDNYIENIMPLVTKKALSMCMGTISFLIMLMFFILGTWLFLEEYDKIKNEWKNIAIIRAFIPLTAEVKHTVGEYMRTQGIIICIVAVICCAGLFLTGNEYALLIGIVIAVLDAFPIVGSGSILIPWAVVYVIYGDFKNSAILAVTYLLSLIVREVLESRIMGHRTGLRPIYMLLSFYVGVKLFGIAGVILGPVGLVFALSLCKMLL